MKGVGCTTLFLLALFTYTTKSKYVDTCNIISGSLRTELNDRASDAVVIELDAGQSCQLYGVLGDNKQEDVDVIKIRTSDTSPFANLILHADVDSEILGEDWTSTATFTSTLRFFTNIATSSVATSGSTQPTGETDGKDKFLTYAFGGGETATEVYVGVSYSSNVAYNLDESSKAGITTLTEVTYVITISLQTEFNNNCTEALVNPTSPGAGTWASDCGWTNEATCALSCGAGYEPSVGSGIATCTSGVWVNGDMFCENAGCDGALTNPVYGTWGNSGCANSGHGDTCTLTCINSGYTIGAGLEEATCVNGVWNNANRNCEDVNECADTPCLHGGTCINTVGSFACDCDSTDNWFGDTCNEKLITFTSVSPTYGGIADVNPTFSITFSQDVVAGESAARLRIWDDTTEIATVAIGSTTINGKVVTFSGTTLEASSPTNEKNYAISIDAGWVQAVDSGSGYFFNGTRGENWRFTTTGAETTTSPTLTIATTLTLDNYKFVNFCAAIQTLLFAIPCSFIKVLSVDGGSTVIHFQIVGTANTVEDAITAIENAETSGELAAALQANNMGDLIPGSLITNTANSALFTDMELALEPNTVGDATVFTAFLTLSQPLPKNGKIQIRLPDDFSVTEADLQGGLLTASTLSNAKVDVGTLPFDTVRTIYDFTMGTATEFIADTDTTPDTCINTLSNNYCISDGNLDENGCAYDCANCPGRTVTSGNTCQLSTITSCAPNKLCSPNGASNFCSTDCSDCDGMKWPNPAGTACAAPSEAVCAASSKKYCAAGLDGTGDSPACVDSCDVCPTSYESAAHCVAGTACVGAGDKFCRTGGSSSCVSDCSTGCGVYTETNTNTGECMVPSPENCAAIGRAYCLSPDTNGCLILSDDTTECAYKKTTTTSSTFVSNCYTSDGGNQYRCDGTVDGISICVTDCAGGACTVPGLSFPKNGDVTVDYACQPALTTGLCTNSSLPYACEGSDECMDSCSTCAGATFQSETDRLCKSVSLATCQQEDMYYCDLSTSCVTSCSTQCTGKEYGDANMQCQTPSSSVCQGGNNNNKAFCPSQPTECVDDCTACADGITWVTGHACFNASATACHTAGWFYCANQHQCVKTCVAGGCTGYPISKRLGAEATCETSDAQEIAAGTVLKVSVTTGITMSDSCENVKDWIFVVSTLDSVSTLLEWGVEPAWDDACFKGKGVVGVADDATTLTSSWIRFTPTTALVAEVFTLKFYGVRAATSSAAGIQAKIAARNDGSCEGWAQGSMTTEIDKSDMTATFRVTRRGSYDVCFKYRSNWEIADPDIVIKPVDTNTGASVNYGYYSCAQLLSVQSSSNYCGCFYRGNTGDENTNLVMPAEVATSFITQVENYDVQQGCCAYGEDKIQTFTVGSKAWGVCGTNVA